jgi:diguanylate cyclase (GGDEF)-like protein
MMLVSLSRRIPWLSLCFALGVAVMLLNAYLPYRNVQWLAEAEYEIERARDIADELAGLLSTLKDVQTGERGYVLTGKSDYLQPYHRAVSEVEGRFNRLHLLAIDNQEISEFLRDLRQATQQQMAIAQRIVALRERGDVNAATDVIRSGVGEQALDRVRALVQAKTTDKQRKLGMLQAEHQRRERFLETSLVVLTLLDILVFAAVWYFAMRLLRGRTAAQAALAASSEQLQQGMHDLQWRNRQTALLAKMTNALHSCSTSEESFAVVEKFCGQLLPDFVGTAYFLKASRDLLEPLSVIGAPSTLPDPIALDDCWALRRGQPHVVLDPAHDMACRHVSRANGTAARPYLCVPMAAHGDIIGLLSLEWLPTARGLSEIERDLVIAAGEQISLSLANLRLREQLREQSVIDSLTGLYNRRFLQESLKRELLRAERQKKPLSAIMLDIDHFKRLNDTYGHDAGDHVLRTVGKELKQFFRGSDVACRYGGEEIAVVLPETPLAGALTRAEYLRQMISNLELRYGGQLLSRVTVSLGVAAYPQHGSTEEDLLQAADRALYRAKGEGRDRVVAARDTGGGEPPLS